MKYDITIIGAGIVGLATGLKIKQHNPGLKVLIVDKEAAIATHQTGHNSGVIHSGLYYKPGSLKAKNCLDGYRQLLQFCDLHGIPYEICGKVVVATSRNEIPLMQNLLERGKKNGLEGIKVLSKTELLEREPHVNGKSGLFVPQTGIVDYKVVSEVYAKLFTGKDGDIQLGNKVSNIITGKDATTVITNREEFQTRLVVNCAGLYSDKVAKFTNAELPYRIIPFRGEYFEIKKEKQYLVRNLIYPVPDPNFPFLGVHFTRMINGGIEAGPNAVLAFRREGYHKRDFQMKEFYETLSWPGFRKVAGKYFKTGLGEMYRSFSKKAFTKALQHLLPEIKEDDLIPGGAGVRAQACSSQGKLLDDFLILENKYAVNVCNAPSPAATSSLAIGDTVSQLALKHFK